MKIQKLIAMAVLLSALSTGTTWAQQTLWAITSGKGVGAVLQGTGSFISDPLFFAEGHVGSGPECDCLHYHGVLFGEDDPDEDGCGWGCVIGLPATPAAALNDLLVSINNTALFDPALAAKLRSILDTAATAANSQCNTLFLGAADAVADELLGLLSGQPATVLQQYNPVIEDLLQYVAAALDSIKTNTPPVTNAPPCCSVMLVRKHGSTAQAKLFDAKRKINADVGEVIALDVVTCPPNGTVKWDYKFAGQAKGAVPSGAGVAFTKSRFCVLSQRATTVTVTVSIECPDGKVKKDTVTIAIQ